MSDQAEDTQAMSSVPAEISGDWLGIASRAYSASTAFIDSDIRQDWERSIAHFQNRHAAGSKFHTDAYARRSRVFRPKTRTAARSSEAAVAAAMFSTSDLLDVQAYNDQNELQLLAAKVAKALVEYRLENTIPWFLTVVGAFQDTFVHKMCASYQYWNIETREQPRYVLDPSGQQVIGEDGQPVIEMAKVKIVDQPGIDLIPPENIRFDPNCDWRDPVKSSPYLIRIVSMTVSDAMKRIDKGEWLEKNRGQLLTGNKPKDDQTRQERERGRADLASANSHDPTIWVHQNFIRKDGQEWMYWTLGTSAMLSEPVRLEEVTPTGQRPIVIGRSTVETHRPYPMSKSDLIADLQVASNEIVNQRMDNVALVLNKRYILRRGRQIDMEALMRNVPGGGIVTDDPAGDIRVMDTPDVTGSSYQEQDRLDIQSDELMGTFSQGTVSNAKNLSSTVGGMSLASGSATAVQEYDIRVFTETWVEPVLRQLIELEQAYETDAMVIELAALKADIPPEAVTDDLLAQPVRLRVNVGIGATNPQQKVERLMTGLNAVAQLPNVAARVKGDEVIKEVFGALGYKGGERFFTPEDEMPEQGPPPDPRLEYDMKRLELEQRKMEMVEADNRAKRQLDYEMHTDEIALKRELGFGELALREGISLKQLETKLAIDLQRDKTQRDVRALTELNRQNEMELKQRFGSGI